MKVEVITTYYREEFLAPLFMLHYERWADQITTLTEKTPDRKLDDLAKLDWLNGAISRSNADWVVVVDYDEFVFPVPLGTEPRDVLASEAGDMIYSEMVRVWRHRTDRDIDRLTPPVLQRTHGETDHVKPCIFKPAGITMGLGNHGFNASRPVKFGAPWSGVHWANADPAFWVTRCDRDRGQRLSPNNLANGWGGHTLISEAEIRAQCERHLDDPLIIALE